MNVFVLCTGRSGSVTFIKACRHIRNYSAAHESRAGRLGPEHFAYPADHIEADNRLSWFLGRLDRAYGDEAVYVHLRRDEADTARSFTRRYERGIIKAYREEILMGLPAGAEPLAVARDYCQTVNTNIEHFLKDKSRKMEFSLENAREDFRRFWQLIGAEGDLEAALAEWERSYNASDNRPQPGRLGRWLRRLLRSLGLKE